MEEQFQGNYQFNKNCKGRVCFLNTAYYKIIAIK